MGRRMTDQELDQLLISVNESIQRALAQVVDVEGHLREIHERAERRRRCLLRRRQI